MSERQQSSSADQPDRERLEQLLVLRATEGLDPESWGDLESLLDSLPEERPESWELAAAWINLALIEAHEPEPEPLPSHLRQRIVAEGRLAVRSLRGRESVPLMPEKLPGSPTRSPEPNTPAPSAAPGSTRMRHLGWWGYAASLAAGVVLSLMINWEAPKDPERGYRALIASQSDVREVPFESQPGTGVDRLVGSVAWSDTAQEGYLRLAGMPINDPNNSQYQLWIVDPDVGPQPVDGGVFDITALGQSTVLIDSKLAVREPTVFVITSERPGGVVVSDGPFQAVAKFDSS